jgi:hypothetical protein
VANSWNVINRTSAADNSRPVQSTRRAINTTRSPSESAKQLLQLMGIEFGMI